MKICENGIYREMTAEEIAEYQAAALEQEKTPEPLTNERKIELLLDTIATAPTPTVEPKVGYKWQPMYTPSSGFAWELVEDPTALGTTVYVALADGIPTGFNDATFFAEV